jgi:hypothetical protein
LQFIFKFFKNETLKNIYLDSTRFLKEEQPNFNYIDATEVKELTDILVDSEEFLVIFLFFH